MKAKISITIDKETLKKIEEHVARGIFRNKSHAVEFALNKIEKKDD